MRLPMSPLSIDQSNHSPGFLNFQLTKYDDLTLKMASAQGVEMSVANNSHAVLLRTLITQMIILNQGLTQSLTF